jgi:hypothetical protein
MKPPGEGQSKRSAGKLWLFLIFSLPLVMAVVPIIFLLYVWATAWMGYPTR